MPQNYSKRRGSRFRPDPDKYLFNIDTFWYNLDIHNYDLVMDSGLRDILEKGLSSYLHSDEIDSIEVELPGYENPIVFEIQGGQRPIYSFSLRNEDIAIYFSKKYRSDGQCPVKIQINQFKLWEKGLMDAYIESLQVVAALGLEHGQAKLNRIDFCCHSDQWQWTLEDLKTFSYPQNIAKDNHPDFYRLNPIDGIFQTVKYGDRTRCQLRIYNKSIEVEKKGKEYFKEIYKRYGMDSEKVWNVEIEIRRDFLKELKLDNINLYDNLELCFEKDGFSQLWSLLMQNYFHNSSHWKEIEKGKEGIFEKVKGYLIREKDIDSTIEREVAQIRGRLLKFLVTEEENSLGAAINKFVDRLDTYELKKGKSWVNDLNKKKQKYHDYNINKKIRLHEQQT